MSKSPFSSRFKSTYVYTYAFTKIGCLAGRKREHYSSVRMLRRCSMYFTDRGPFYEYVYAISSVFGI